MKARYIGIVLSLCLCLFACVSAFVLAFSRFAGWSIQATEQPVTLKSSPVVVRSNNTLNLDRSRIDSSLARQQRLIPSPTNVPPTPIPTVVPSPTEEPLPTTTPIPPSPTREPENTNDLMKSVNDYRAGKSLNSLESHGALCETAQVRAEEVVNNFSHEGFRSRLDAGLLSQLQAESIAENLWRGSGDADRIVVDWVGSESHRLALEGDWRWGCGVRKDNVAVFLFLK